MSSVADAFLPSRTESRLRPAFRRFPPGAVAVTSASPEPGTIAGKMAGHLAAIASSGDRAAFAELFRYYAPRVKSYLQRLGGDPATAEEVMQEAMVQVWRKAGLFDPAKSSPSTWIFAIARNLRIDALRRDRRPEYDPDDPALVPEPDRPPDTVLEGQQAAARLAEAMAGLTAAERNLLTLTYYEEKSHSMISAELGLPLGTVKSRLRLTFAKLRGALAESFGDRP